MALFGKRKPTPADDHGWTPVAIHIVTASRPLGLDGGGSAGVLSELIDIAVDASGTPYTFLLEVRPADAPAYQVEHQERVPASATRNSLVNLGRGDVKIPDGLDISGWVDPADPTRLKIDWSGFNKSPESKAAVEVAAHAEYDSEYAAQLSNMPPKAVATMRANAVTSATMLAPMVRDGQLPREHFENEAQLNLRRGLLTREQYDAAVDVIEGRA